MASPRRSGRKRIRNTRYSDDVFVDLDHVDVLGASSPKPTSPQRDELHLNDEPVLDPARSQFDHFENVGYLSSDDDGDLNDDDISATNDGSDSEDQSHGSPIAAAVPCMPQSKQVVDAAQYSQGLDFEKLAPELNILSTFDSRERDSLHIARATSKWYSQKTTPLRLPKSDGTGGFAESFDQTASEKDSIATVAWDWYYENGGRAAFARHTVTKVLGAEHGQAYLGHKRVQRHLVWGPHTQQRLFSIPPYHSINLKYTWMQASQDAVPKTRVRYARLPRCGWCINISETVHLAEWIPNQSNNPQYLALAIWSKQIINKTSAFSPSDANMTSIQLWEVFASEMPNGSLTIDNDKPPRLALVLCSNWGLVKHFKWCPVPQRPKTKIDEDGRHNLGLLAVIYSDGKLRVLDVKAPSNQQGDPEYRHYSVSAFEACPTDAICTCLTWISSSLIATGCSNGYVAIWSLCNHLAAPPLPVFYHQLHTTYIRSIASAQPHHPNLLTTVSLDGTIRQTDLRTPQTTTTFSTPSQTSYTHIAWHAATQHFLATTETHNTLRAFDPRTFFRPHTITATAAAAATPFSLATSPLHPFVLVGTTHGAAISSNPLRRLAGPKHRRGAHNEYLQKWLGHKWRRGSPAADETSTAAAAPLDFPAGLVRLTTGYAPQGAAAVEQNAKARGGAVIDEEETGVRCVAWNANVACGGWAVGGMGSGVVVIEDLALD